MALQCENAFHGEILKRHSLRLIRFYSLRTKLGKLGQAPMGCQGYFCSLTTTKDTTDSVTNSAADSVDHAANGIGGTAHNTASCVSDTADNTTLRPKISTRSEFQTSAHPRRQHNGRGITYNGIQGT